MISPSERRKFDKAVRIHIMSAELGLATDELARKHGCPPPEVAEVLAHLQQTVVRHIAKAYIPRKARARK